MKLMNYDCDPKRLFKYNNVGTDDSLYARQGLTL